MRLQFITLLLVVSANSISATCLASDSHEAFLQGLRDRAYYDTALEYLDTLAGDAKTSADMKATLDLERAIIWVERSNATRRQDDRERFAGQGQVSFEVFLKEHPQHPRAAWGYAHLGRLLFDQARQKIWTCDAPANTDQREAFMNEARKILQRAKRAFGKARNQFKMQLDNLPIVDPDDDKDGYQNRRRTEVRYLGAWLSFVSCVYEDALTQDPDSGRRSDLLEMAQEQFKEIHTFSRSSAAGQHAKLMMGKCWQELGDISQALGYFDELRNQPSQDPYMQRLSRTAQYYRLTCLNHESREEFQNVVADATQWLKQHQGARNTEAGLGILFEKAVATEALARNGNMSEEQQQLRLRQTLADLDLVSAVVSPVQETARVAVGRLRDELGEDQQEPKSFDSAFDRGRQIVGRLQESRDAVQLAQTDNNRQQATQELELLQAEAGRMFQLAIQLRKPDSDRSAIAQARYLLSYVFLQQRKSYDAFVLARHVMRRHKEDAAETAADATEMAISAAVQIWSDASPDDREFELNLVREICEEVILAFPGSRRATDARMRLGRSFLDLDQPREAAQAFLQVPQEDAGYAAARIEAGQAWWLAWAQASSKTAASDRTPIAPATLAEWKQQARTLLTEGIHLSRAAQADSSLNEDVVRAEVSLSGLLNQDGDFAETVRRLAEGNPTVLSAIETDQPRPARGVRSVAFAGLCYRTLLRAYVGTQQIDDALAVMKKLQNLGATNTTAIYTQLGRELQLELARLRDSGETERLREVRTSFEEFLEQVYESRDASSSGALLWIGETYAGLAQGAKDAADADKYFHKAGTIYQELLQSKLDAATTAAVRLRLIRVYRQRKQFQRAVALATEVLTANASSVSVQMEAAHVLADWGENGEPERLLESIRGVPVDQKDKTIWGWAAIARRLQRSRQAENWAELKPLFLEARYELSNSRMRYARLNSDAGREQLEAAARELTSMVQVSTDLNDEWWARFSGLYREIQTQLGHPGLTLSRPSGEVAAILKRDNVVPVQPGDSADLPAANSVSSPESDTNQPSMLLRVAGIGMIVVIVGAVCFLIMRRPKRGVRRSYGNEQTAFQLPIGTPSDSVSKTRPPRRLAETEKPRRRRPKSEGSSTPTDEKRRRPPRKPEDRPTTGKVPESRKKKRTLPPPEDQ